MAKVFFWQALLKAGNRALRIPYLNALYKKFE